MTREEHEAVTNAIGGFCEAWDNWQTNDDFKAVTFAALKLKRALSLMQRTRPTGSAGGRARTPAQTAARRANGAKGGRKPSTKAQS